MSDHLIDFQAKREAAALRKAKREIKRLELRMPRMGKKPKRKKSPTLSKLKKLLWVHISLIVRSWSSVCLACGVNPTNCAAHIVPSNDGAATRFFLPNLYPCCIACNKSEYHQRGSWVYKHREIFGADLVDCLYAMSETPFQLKKHWVLEQTERMKKLRGIA